MHKHLSRLARFVRFQLWLRTAYVPVAGGDYDDVIDRDAVDSLIPEEVSNTLLKNLESNSSVLSSFTRIPVSRKQVRLPILASLPSVAWVNTPSTGRRKPVTKVTWADKFLDIEELAVIVVVEDDSFDDADEPIWERVRPLVEQAAGRHIDNTVYFGVNAPAAFPTNVVDAATAVGNIAALGTATAEQGGIVSDQADMLEEVESQGYDLTQGIANRRLKAAARRARNANGDRFGEVAIGKNEVEIDGVTYNTDSMRGLWPTGNGQPISVAIDTDEFVFGLRQDVTWKVLDQAVIQDADGEIVHNLAQEDKTGLRFVFRGGWQVGNTIRYDEEVEANRYPAGLLTSNVSS